MGTKSAAVFLCQFFGAHFFEQSVHFSTFIGLAFELRANTNACRLKNFHGPTRQGEIRFNVGGFPIRKIDPLAKELIFSRVLGSRETSPSISGGSF